MKKKTRKTRKNTGEIKTAESTRCNIPPQRQLTQAHLMCICKNSIVTRGYLEHIFAFRTFGCLCVWWIQTLSWNKKPFFKAVFVPYMIIGTRPSGRGKVYTGRKERESLNPRCVAVPERRLVEIFSPFFHSFSCRCGVYLFPIPVCPGQMNTRTTHIHKFTDRTDQSCIPEVQNHKIDLKIRWTYRVMSVTVEFFLKNMPW